MSRETKDRLALRMQPETKRKIEQWYEADNCRSRNEFIEKAVNFYADYLDMNNGSSLLPKEIITAIDGRLAVFESRFKSLMFKLLVEMDMVMCTVADCVQLDEEYLRQKRARSVNNIKQTGGQLSFERIARGEGDE